MISENLKLVTLLSLLIILLIITLFVRKHRISIKYSLVWYSYIFMLLIFIIFPTTLVWLTKIFKLQLASNLLFILVISFLFIITISLTIIVSNQKEKIKLLIQEVSLLKERENKNV